MNYGMIAYVIGWILSCEGILLIPSILVALIYREVAGWAVFLTSAVCFLAGLPFLFRKPANTTIYAKEGFVTVALSWIILSIMGSFPFLLSGEISNPVDALFETVSGFTTTGASILTDVESMSRCLVFWRSFTHWIGGMGMLVFILTVLPMAGGSHMNLMKAESPGPSVEKLVPTVRTTATVLYLIYVGMTIVQVVLMLFGGMNLFDSLTLSFGTAGTGGFAIRNDSASSYTPYIQIVITVFMILFGVNFSVYFLILSKRFRQAIQSEELRWYLCIIGGAILIITIDICHMYGGTGEALRHAAFQVGSIITTTGYSTVDFNLWPTLSRHILVLLMFIGACAGSTGGGIKVSRIIILMKTIGRQLNLFLHPTGVRQITMDGKPIQKNMIRTINAFMSAYVLLFILSFLLISLEGYDGVTTFTAVAATYNNIGPGLELVGPMANFAHFSNGSKLVFIFDMLVGRLEVFPMLLLFYPATWRKF